MSIYPPTGTLEIKDATLKIPVIDLQYTSNTAKIEANSNVVTEFSRSKKLIKYPRVAMTSATTGGYTATASGEESATRQVENLFNNLKSESGGGWRSNTGYNSSGVYTGSSNLGSDSGGTAFANADKGEWVKIELPHKIQLNSFTLTPRLSTSVPSGSALSYGRAEFIKNGKIWGSLNGTSWSVVHTISGSSASSDTVTNSYTVSSSTAYNYFALVVTNTNTGLAGIVGTSLSEWELYGTPEYDPEAHGVDVTVKSLPNVPNTDWLEVYYDGQDYTADTDFDQANEVLDKSGNNLHGSQAGGVGFDTEYKAFTFDGSNDYITSSTLSSHFEGDPNVTYACWVKFNAMTTGQMFLTINAPGVYLTNEIGGFYIGTDGTIYNTIGSRGIQATDKLTTNIWYHIVGTKVTGNTGTDTQKLYIDGRLVPQTIWGSSGTQVIGSNPILRLGGAGNGNDRLNGSIANARLFNRALTQDEIYQLYAYQKEYFGHGDLSMTLKAGRLGIGTSEPRAALDVRGDIHGGCPIYFAAYNTNGTTAGNTVIWDELWISRGDGYDTGTGIFTAPLAGVYKFYYTLRRALVAGNPLYARVQLNGSDLSTQYGAMGLRDARDQAGSTVLLKLNAGDTISVKVYNYDMASANSSFVGEYFSSL